MNRIASILLLCSLLFACKKKDDNTPRPEPEPPVAAKTIDSIKVTTQLKTMPIPLNNPGNDILWFTLFNSRLYWTNPSNTPVPVPQFMYAYNISSNTLSGIPPHEEVAAAGFMSALINDGTSIYYVANEAWSFTPFPLTPWNQINYPASVKDNNGEAGVVYSPMDSRIYFVGGRVPSRKVKSMAKGGTGWRNDPDFLYETRMPVMVVADGKIYAMGGGGFAKKMSSYVPGGNWTALPDIGFEVVASASNRLAAVYTDRFILLLQPATTFGGPASLCIYDIKTAQWKKDPIELTIRDRNLNIFSDNDKIYVVGKNTSNDVVLHELALYDIPAQ